MFSLLSLFDDIASTLDDVAVMTKLAIRKTTGLMSDDLAVNTGVVHGVKPHRELPMVWKIFIGSLLNKVYCIVGVLVLVATYPVILKGVLLLGGLFLSYEGVHKIFVKLSPTSSEKEAKIKVSIEEKIKGAIRTDLILSIEIIVLAHSSMEGGLLEQTLALTLVGVLASVIIYGLVALLVKIDDFGLLLIERNFKRFGLFLVQSMPYLMKGLGILGTIAMLLVGGGIIQHLFHLPLYLPEILQNLILGGTLGIIVLLPVATIQRLR